MKREKRRNNREGLGQNNRANTKSQRSVFIILNFKRVQWPQINFPLQLCIVQYLNISLGPDNLCVWSFLWQLFHDPGISNILVPLLQLDFTFTILYSGLSEPFSRKGDPASCCRISEAFWNLSTSLQDLLTLAFCMPENCHYAGDAFTLHWQTEMSSRPFLTQLQWFLFSLALQPEKILPQ